MNAFAKLAEIKKTEKPLEWWTTMVIYKLSTPLVYIIKDSPIKPNHLTLASLVIVILASLIIALGSYSGFVVAAILLQISFLLDNADGQLARLRGVTSGFGHWLDSTCDRLCELFIITSLTFRFSQVNDQALFFGFYCLFLIYYFHGAEAKALPFTKPEEKREIESREGPFLRRITAWRHKLRWIPLNSGEQYFLFSLFLLLNRIDLFFYFFTSYASVVTIAFPLYKYYHYRLSLKEKTQ